VSQEIDFVKTPVVICVDDEPTVLESLKVELRRNLVGKCLIETAESGSDALHLLGELITDQYDVAVVLADYIMPGLRGDELLHEVTTQSPQTRNIMLSGQADLDAVGRSIQYANLYRFISKPWHSEDLKLTILEAVQCYHRDQTIAAQTAETKKLLQEITKLNSSLENQVQERTAQLNQSLQELRELSQLKDDFLHAMSHDLRTPVAGMLLVLKKLQNKGLETVDVDRSIIDRMVSGCERQLQMLENLLEAHSSEIHGIKLQLETYDLYKLSQAICDELLPLVQSYQGELINMISPDLPATQMDVQQIRRVFENVIVNALKHNPPGIKIQIAATRQGDMLQCTIKDNGVGMSPIECEMMFERYRQGKSKTRHTGGIGLGLHISRQIIQEHGGQIGAVSQPGAGVEIWFTLPIV
jgi:two-component system, sensor histidine kinase and response regulator